VEEIRGLGLGLAAAGLIGWFRGALWNLTPGVERIMRTWLGSYLVGFGLLVALLSHGILAIT
jgi:hypothetical protein